MKELRIERLKPCPFCGIVDQLSIQPIETHGIKGVLPADSAESWWCVKCMKCGCDGPLARPFAEMAIRYWNTRIPPEVISTWKLSEQSDSSERSFEKYLTAEE